MCILLYNALEIPANSTAAQIRSSFIAKAKQICPDRQLNHPEWQAVNEYFAYILFAYEILKCPEKREAYDSNGFKGLQARGICIPAGFSNFKNQVMSRLPHKVKCPHSSASTNKDKIKKETKPLSEQWLKETEEKMRMKHNESTIPIAVYKQIVKIAWKKEILNERRNQPFSCSKTRE